MLRTEGSGGEVNPKRNQADLFARHVRVLQQLVRGVLRRRNDANGPLHCLQQQCGKLLLEIRSRIVLTGHREQVDHRDDLFSESERRRPLHQAVEHIRLPGQPERPGVLVVAHGEPRAPGTRCGIGPKEFPARFEPREPVTEQVVVLTFDFGETFNQPPAIDRHAGRLRSHSISSIKSDRSHQMDFRFCSLICRMFFPGRATRGRSSVLGTRDIFQVVLFDFAIDSGLADPEQLGGSKAVAARHFQGLPDGIPLNLTQS